MRTVSDQNVARQVTDELRDAIYAGELKPGDRLVERKLAADLGVSHIPVREALARLIEEGLIEKEPRRGARVARLTPRDLEELTSMRIVLEQFVVERVITRWNPDARALLSAQLDEMASAAPGDTATLFRQDRAFHETLASLAEHGILSDVSTRLQGRVAAFILATTSELPADQQAAHVHSHQLIIDALDDGDLDAARAVVAEHITQGAARIRVDDLAEERPTDAQM